MKNKIIAIMLLVAVIIPMFSFVSADTTEDTITLDNFALSDEQRQKAEQNGYYIYTNGSSGTSISYIVQILQNEGEYYLYLKNDFIYHSKGYVANSYLFDYNFTQYKEYLNQDYSNNYSTTKQNFDSDTLICTFPVYTDSTCSEVYRPADLQDDTIGDPNSDLQLSYEYNEDFTECHINATLKNGSFTDKIYYSNIMPSISGQGLLTKNGFPAERFNS